MAPHSSTLAWKIPWMEETSGPQFMRSLRVGQDSAENSAHCFAFEVNVFLSENDQLKKFFIFVI